MERTPDPRYNDRLLAAGNDDDNDDDELARVMEMSRREYAEQEARRAAAEAELARLRRRLAVPVSRLRLWADTTRNDYERACLRRLLSCAKTRMEGGTPPPLGDEDVAFVETHLRPSPLFGEACETLFRHGGSASCTPPGGG